MSVGFPWPVGSALPARCVSRAARGLCLVVVACGLLRFGVPRCCFPHGLGCCWPAGGGRLLCLGVGWFLELRAVVGPVLAGARRGPAAGIDRRRLIHSVGCLLCLSVARGAGLVLVWREGSYLRPPVAACPAVPIGSSGRAGHAAARELLRLGQLSMARALVPLRRLGRGARCTRSWAPWRPTPPVPATAGVLGSCAGGVCGSGCRWKALEVGTA